MTTPDQPARHPRTPSWILWGGISLGLIIMTVGFIIAARHCPPRPEAAAASVNPYEIVQRSANRHEAWMLWAETTTPTQRDRDFAHLLNAEWSQHCQQQHPNHPIAQADCYHEQLAQSYPPPAPVTPEALASAIQIGYYILAHTADQFIASPQDTRTAAYHKRKTQARLTEHCFYEWIPLPPESTQRPWTTYQQALTDFDQCLTAAMPKVTHDATAEAIAWPSWD